GGERPGRELGPGPPDVGRPCGDHALEVGDGERVVVDQLDRAAHVLERGKRQGGGAADGADAGERETSEVQAAGQRRPGRRPVEAMLPEGPGDGPLEGSAGLATWLGQTPEDAFG